MTVSIAEALVGDPWPRGQRLGAGLAASSLHPSEHGTENEQVTEQVDEGEPAVENEPAVDLNLIQAHPILRKNSPSAYPVPGACAGLSELPEPPSAATSQKLLPGIQARRIRPSGAEINVLTKGNDRPLLLIHGHPGFKVTIYAGGDARPIQCADNVQKMRLSGGTFTMPRPVRVAPNGDLFLTDSGAGVLFVLRGVKADGKAEVIEKLATSSSGRERRKTLKHTRSLINLYRRC
jgi:hypothetical protein